MIGMPAVTGAGRLRYAGWQLVSTHPAAPVNPAVGLVEPAPGSAPAPRTEMARSSG